MNFPVVILAVLAGGSHAVAPGAGDRLAPPSRSVCASFAAGYYLELPLAQSEKFLGAIRMLDGLRQKDVPAREAALVAAARALRLSEQSSYANSADALRILGAPDTLVADVAKMAAEAQRPLPSGSSETTLLAAVDECTDMARDQRHLTPLLSGWLHVAASAKESWSYKVGGLAATVREADNDAEMHEAGTRGEQLAAQAPSQLAEPKALLQHLSQSLKDDTIRRHSMLRDGRSGGATLAAFFRLR